MSRFPLLAIVGAPNVGKSRLFNRLTGSRSIVNDRPGVTRDRLEAQVEWSGRRFRVQDTGGLVPGERDELSTAVARQVLSGVAEADLLLLVVDARAGLSPLDQNLAGLLRRSDRRILLAVNKVDSEAQEAAVADFFVLGFPDPVPVSAEQGRGVGSLLDRIAASLPSEIPTDAADRAGSRGIRLAIVGRPNVGKSMLFNRLVGRERAVVSAVPGTTRDPVEARFEHRDREYELVDTAGLRRKAPAEAEVVEGESITRTFLAMKGADVVLILLEAPEPATHQDRAIVAAGLRLRRPLIIGLNKVDLLDRETPLEDLRERTRRDFPFSADIPVVPFSARTGRNVPELLGLLAQVVDESSRRFPTPALNAALEEAVRKRAPIGKGRILRLYYATQTGVFPPSFLIFTNGVPVVDSYRRYLARQLKACLGLQIAQVALRFRRRR